MSELTYLAYLRGLLAWLTYLAYLSGLFTRTHAVDAPQVLAPHRHAIAESPLLRRRPPRIR
jgi:hypothetical protein